MSIDAVIGRIDQIIACQQMLSGAPPQTAATSNRSGFAAELSSAQNALATGPATTAPYSTASDTMPATMDALPTSSAATSTANNPGAAAAAKMLAAAQAAVGGSYNQGNHDAVSDHGSQIQQLGTDCSGFLSYLMGPNGVGDWSQSYCTPDIPTAPGIQPGKGAYVTIYNNANPGNAGHVWVEILGKYYESAGSTGVHQMDQSEVNMYLNSGQYQPFHPAGI